MHVQVDRLGALVADEDVFRETRADSPLAHDREVCVDVDRAGPGHQEELHLVVVEVVCRQHVWHLAVDGQHPAGEKSCIPREQAFRLGQGRADVAGAIADDERVAFKDAYGLPAHAATGTRRRKVSANARSPVRRILP